MSNITRYTNRYNIAIKTKGTNLKTERKEGEFTTVEIEYFHASKYGNGAKVAQDFKEQMTAKGIGVNIHHVRDARPREMPSADLYLFSSPGRMGRPIGCMRRFLKKVKLPEGARYSILTTEMAPQPQQQTDRLPNEEEPGKCQLVRPWMNKVLQEKGLVKIAEERVLVTGLKGPLEVGWHGKVEKFTEQISIYLDRKGKRGDPI